MKLPSCAATVKAGKLTTSNPEQEMITAEVRHWAEVHVSAILESRGIPDPYRWRFNKLGQLIPENSNVPVEEVIVRNNPVARAEYEAFLEIQRRAFEMESGFIVWISPIDSTYYPETSKIVISEKIGGILLNRSINTDWDRLGCILVARELSQLSEVDGVIYKSVLDVRANPIFIDGNRERELSLVLKKILDRKSLEMIATGADFATKERLMMEYFETGRVAPLGDGPLSCPEIMGGQTAFQVFSGEKQILKCVKCPFCEKTVDAEIYGGEIHCPECKKSAKYSS